MSMVDEYAEDTLFPGLEDILVELKERREEFHGKRYVPRDFIDRLVELGLYRFAAPIQFGGEPMPPSRFLRIVERVSMIDGSTGWVVAFASALTYLGALPVETQAELYADGPDVVYAGGLFPMQPAERTEKGFLVNGTWKYASGCMAADWIGVGLLDESAGGKPRAAVLPKDKVEIVNNWDVTGMAATGSFDTVVEDVEVPEEWTFIRGGASTIDEPLYRYPTLGFQAQVHSAIAMGVAHAALDLVRANGGRTGVTGAPPQAARAYYRIDFAKAYADFHSARAFYYQVADEAWAASQDGRPTDEQVARVRLAATHIAHVSAQVVRDLTAISGTGVISNSHPMQRLIQDVQVSQLHATLLPSVYDAFGAVLMGQPPSAVPAFV